MEEKVGPKIYYELFDVRTMNFDSTFSSIGLYFGPTFS